jgi:F-type H+-transporting ATPase subunit a
MENPLHHFELHTLVPLSLFGIDISINKAVIMMWIACILIFLFFRLAGAQAQLVPGLFQSLAEVSIDFLRGLTTEYMGKEGRRYFPFIATLFFFILFCNLLGLIPGAYTVTSQLMVTGTFAFIVYLISLLVGLGKHGAGFLKILVPSGTPIWLLPLMIPIEVISQLARPVTLALRLFANMTAGHTVLAVLFGLTVGLEFYLGWLPFGFSVLVYGLELFIAFIQAYIFSTLACVYIGDAIKLH